MKLDAKRCSRGAGSQCDGPSAFGTYRRGSGNAVEKLAVQSDIVANVFDLRSESDIVAVWPVRSLDHLHMSFAQSNTLTSCIPLSSSLTTMIWAMICMLSADL